MDATLKEFFKSLDDYWFGYGSPTTLGLFRILIGFFTLMSLTLTAFVWEAFFSDRGYVPYWIGANWSGPIPPIMDGWPQLPRLNLLAGVADDRLSAIVYGVAMLAAALTTLGLWTRASSIVLAIGVVTIHHRNPVILNGADSMIRNMCILMAVAPVGRACSLDRLIRLWRGQESSELSEVSLWPQRIISFNVALVYLTTVWLKWSGAKWPNGTATWYPVRVPEFQRFPVPAFLTEMGMVRVTTYGTLIVEFALATFVFYRPLRKYVVLAGVLMHGYIEYSMNIPMFSFVMVSCYIAFYEGDEFGPWMKRVGDRLARFRITVRLPGTARLKPEAEMFLEAVDPMDLVRFDATSDMAIPLDQATAKVITRSPGLWPLVPFAGRLLRASIEPMEDARR